MQELWQHTGHQHRTKQLAQHPAAALATIETQLCLPHHTAIITAAAWAVAVLGVRHHCLWALRLGCAAAGALGCKLAHAGSKRRSSFVHACRLFLHTLCLHMSAVNSCRLSASRAHAQQTSKSKEEHCCRSRRLLLPACRTCSATTMSLPKSCMLLSGSRTSWRSSDIKSPPTQYSKISQRWLVVSYLRTTTPQCKQHSAPESCRTLEATAPLQARECVRARATDAAPIASQLSALFHDMADGSRCLPGSSAAGHCWPSHLLAEHGGADQGPGWVCCCCCLLPHAVFASCSASPCIELQDVLVIQGMHGAHLQQHQGSVMAVKAPRMQLLRPNPPLIKNTAAAGGAL